MTLRPTSQGYITLDAPVMEPQPFSTRTQAEAAMRIFNDECLPNLRAYGFTSNISSNIGSHVIQVTHHGIRLGDQQREQVKKRINLYLSYHPAHCVRVDYGLNVRP